MDSKRSLQMTHSKAVEASLKPWDCAKVQNVSAAMPITEQAGDEKQI